MNALVTVSPKAHCTLCVHVCTRKGVVYELLMPTDQVEHARSCLTVIFPFVFAQDMMMNSFGMIDNMMSNVRNRMEEMHKNFVSLLQY